MRFLHTGDWHIGANRTLPGYFLRQEEMINSVFDVAYDNNVDVVVIAGDIFDDPKTTTQEERELVERKFIEYDAAGFSILAIPGNHDLIDATGYTALRYLSLLSQHGKLCNSLITEQTAYVVKNGVVFCLLSHGRGNFKEVAQKAVEDYSLSSMSVGMDLVVVAHETIKGALGDFKLKDGSYYALEQGEEAPDESLPVKYWALGDLHTFQNVSRNAFYSGSPLQTKFNDSWPKGVCIVDTDDPTNPVFVPIESNQFVKLHKGEVAPANSYVKWSFSSQDEIPKDIPANVVKIEITNPDQELSLDLTGDVKDKLLAAVKQQGASEEDLVLASEEISSLLVFASLASESDDL